jgi:hypothetical protein
MPALVAGIYVFTTLEEAASFPVILAVSSSA